MITRHRDLLVTRVPNVKGNKLLICGQVRFLLL